MRTRNTPEISKVDESVQGFSERDLRQIGRDVTRGYRRFFEKRGEDPDSFTDFSRRIRRHKKQQIEGE